jgi:predicted nucleic acid-binding protein
VGIILDTCVLIKAEKQTLAFDHLVNLEDEVFITAITESELLVGVNMATSEAKRNTRSVFVEHVLNHFAILDFSIEAARIHAQIYANLAQKGEMIGAHDLIIAAISLTCGYSLVTDNAREFNRVSGLKVIELKSLYVD